MNIYTQKVKQLSQMIDKVEGKVNRSMRKKIAPMIYDSGMEFLQRIHEEEPSIGATKEELQEEQEMYKQQSISEKSKKPELTVEYLKSIGLENYGIWGNS